MIIELKQSEIENAGFTVPEFQGLELVQMRWLASRIYRTHRDPEDHFRADMMDLAHPNFSRFVILVGQ